jgi:hypothetical protein
VKQLLASLTQAFSPSDAGPAGHLWVLRELLGHCAVAFLSYLIFVVGVIQMHQLIGLVKEMSFQFGVLCFAEDVVFTFGTIIFLVYMALCSLRAFRHLYHGFREVIGDWEKRAPGHQC